MHLKLFILIVYFSVFLLFSFIFDLHSFRSIHYDDLYMFGEMLVIVCDSCSIVYKFVYGFIAILIL